MKINSEMFATEGQWRKFIKVRGFFEELIRLKKKGYFFLVDGDIERNPFIDGIEIGFDDNCRILFVGATTTFNEKTFQWDIPWVDISVTELKKRVIPLKRASWSNILG